MQVYEVKDGMEVKPGCAYIIPPNRDMALLRGKLQLLEPTTPRGIRLPIDFFFRSLAADQRDRAICIVLSGTGSDGTLGLRAVKGEGGMAMVQTPETTEFDSMPRSAIATGLVDYILPPAKMPDQLIAYVDQIFGKKTKPPASLQPHKAQDTLAKICVLLRAKTGHDFSQYKENTLNRRIERRMALHQIDRSSDYLRFMQQDANEAHALFRDLLIGVTSFFRDDDAFAALTSVGIPRLFEGVPPGGPVRVWVCGCSTGEEAYSIAILIQEHLEKLLQAYKVQIFATDIDRVATDQARTGVFPASIAADVSPERLTRFFSQDSGGSYRIHKTIRDLLIFSEQDVLKDPPFSKVGLISCRNLLIYLNADLQKRLLPLFHYALNPGGMLFLGNSETIGDQPWLFEALDRKARLYVRKDEVSGIPRPLIGSLAATAVDPRTANAPATEANHEGKLNVREVTYQTLLRHLAQAAVLVNGHGEILYYHGRTGNYLEPAPGDAGANILTMAREGLRRDLTSALHHAVAKREIVHANGLCVKTNGSSITANLAVIPAGISSAPDLYVVTLDEKPPLGAVPAGKKGKSSKAQVSPTHTRIATLESELRAKDEYIQTIVEEMETSSEELKSSNEEMQSVNEEMQSTNEELETSKEELQSVNEELATVNAELQQKVSDLSRINNDMNNLLAGTGVGTLFVDHQLRIARFTPSATQVINLIPGDVGRPLAHIVSNLVGHDDLMADVQSVLDTLVPVDVEVQTKSGGWYILGIRPYRTLENVIEGAVITFVDITARKTAERKLLEAERFRKAAEIETVGIVFFKIDGPITSANGAFLRMIGYTQPDLDAGKISWDSITPPEALEPSRQALKELKASGRSAPYERPYLRRDGSCGLALFAAWRIAEGEAVVYVIDVERKNLSQAV
jgi:two-component system CheB/CheR fusion protein